MYMIVSQLPFVCIVIPTYLNFLYLDLTLNKETEK